MTKIIGVLIHTTINIAIMASWGAPAAAQVQPPAGILLGEVKIAGAEEWVEVVSNSAVGIDLALYSIEVLGFDGAPRP